MIMNVPDFVLIVHHADVQVVASWPIGVPI